MNRPSITLLHGDCIEVMATLPDKVAHLVVTDPPFNSTDCHWDTPFDFAAWWTQINRVTTENAVVACFAAQPFGTDLINSNRKQFRYELVWDKLAPVGFLNANRQPMRVHEQIIIFCRRPGKATYTPQKFPGKPYRSKARAGDARTPIYRRHKPVETINAGDRHPTSILRFAKPAHNRRRHPTEKPAALLNWLVRSYSCEGQTVLDPFAGSFSTIEAAAAAGRSAIGIERDPIFFASARKRFT